MALGAKNELIFEMCFRAFDNLSIFLIVTIFPVDIMSEKAVFQYAVKDFEVLTIPISHPCEGKIK